MVAGWHPDGASRVAGGRSLPAGWWCCDGDKFASGDVSHFYDEAALVATPPIVSQALSQGTLDWGTMAWMALAAAAVAVLLALV
jgi:hypothetical protein